MGGTKKVGPIERDVPSFIAKPAGHIIIKWAYLEYQLSRIIWKLLGLSVEEGRLAVADPRAHEKLETIRNILFTRNKVISDEKFNKLWKLVSEVQVLRDMLAHGLWVKDEKGWSILKFKGNVVDQQIHKLGRNRKIRPEPFLATPANLAGVNKAVTDIINSVESLEASIPLPDKSQEQSEKAGRKTPARKASKRKRPPKPSRGK